LESATEEISEIEDLIEGYILVTQKLSVKYATVILAFVTSGGRRNDFLRLHCLKTLLR